MSGPSRDHVLALCGGVGGAKLALGLSRSLPPDRLTIAVNTGDDFEHLGLTICPDIDTVLYTLGGLANALQGWGIEGESWAFMGALKRLGGEDWFALGDQDLATHVERTRRLRAGDSLSEVTAFLAGRLGIRPRVIPMSDDPVRTVVDTEDGALDFQHYFVRDRCAPVVRSVAFRGAEEAAPSAGLLQALRRNDLAAIVICPSNPYLSIDPILAVPGVRQALLERSAPCVAVSPIVGGAAIKGPTAKLMRELKLDPGPVAIADHYRGLIDGLVIDQIDDASAQAVEAAGAACRVAQTVMRTDADKDDLAAAVLRFASALRRS